MEIVTFELLRYIAGTLHQEEAQTESIVHETVVLMFNFTLTRERSVDSCILLGDKSPIEL